MTSPLICDDAIDDKKFDRGETEPTLKQLAIDSG